MPRYFLILIATILVGNDAFACMGPDSEIAQESDASVLFEGTVKSYELGPKGPVPGVTSDGIAKVSFTVTKTSRGENKKLWSAIMRGASLPKTLEEFKKRFGTSMSVGLRDFSKKIDQTKLPKGYQDLLFVVDAACSMNKEDWYLRPVSAK